MVIVAIFQIPQNRIKMMETCSLERSNGAVGFELLMSSSKLK